MSNAGRGAVDRGGEDRVPLVVMQQRRGVYELHRRGEFDVIAALMALKKSRMTSLSSALNRVSSFMLRKNSSVVCSAAMMSKRISM